MVLIRYNVNEVGNTQIKNTPLLLLLISETESLIGVSYSEGDDYSRSH